MKIKNVMAIVFILCGVNLITFATTRQWTTKHVLTSAIEQVDATIKKSSLYQQDLGPSIPSDLSMAIWTAGGRYYWWNDAIPYWTAGIMLTIYGVAVSFYEPKRRMANKTRHPTPTSRPV
jgi:hypothetical protein